MLNPFLLCSIVFANKTVFTVLDFHFVYTLTLLHVLTTLGGMLLFAALGFYERKPLPVRSLLSLAASFVGYIVFWNLSLQVGCSLSAAHDLLLPLVLRLNESSQIASQKQEYKRNLPCKNVWSFTIRLIGSVRHHCQPGKDCFTITEGL